MKLARKLTIALILGVTLVLAVNAYVRVQREITHFESEMERDAVVMGRALSAALTEIWRSDGEQVALRVVELANLRNSGVKVRWVFLDEDAVDPHRPLLDRAQLLPLAEGREVVRKIRPDGTEEHLVTYIPMTASAPRPGALEFAESLEDERLYIRKTILRISVTTAIVALVCALLTTALGAFFVGRPMRRLIEQARRVGAGDLTGRLDVKQDDEIGELAREMNAMCEQLAAADRKIADETTARIAALEQLRHADRLATVGKLASGIAHELGTPLQIVSGRARMIADGDVEGADIPSSARVILEQSQRITKIIRQLLDFARRRRAEKVDVDLTALVSHTLSLLSTLADKKHLRVRLEGDPGPLRAHVDPEQIQQALMNLAVNAVDASDRGGELVFGLTSLRARAPADLGDAEGEHACIYVQDRGEGMTKETMEHVFEPFFTTKQVGSGTGLGLSVSYGIIREHGGWIDVESELGAGSRFAIYLPREPPG